MAIRFTYTPPKVDATVVLAGAAELAVDAVAHEMLDGSQPLVPVADGVLKASGRVVPGEVMRGLATAYVTYGRDDDGTATHAPSNQYAVIEHEDGEVDHANGGEFKFLEKPMHQVALHALETMGGVVRKAMGM